MEIVNQKDTFLKKCKEKSKKKSSFSNFLSYDHLKRNSFFFVFEQKHGIFQSLNIIFGEKCNKNNKN